MKVFISMPMRGMSALKIDDTMKNIVSKLKGKVSSDIELIDSVFYQTEREMSVNTASGKEYKNNPLYCLGYSIQKMAEADLVVFAPGWEEARGCKIEYDIAEAYGKLIIDLEKYQDFCENTRKEVEREPQEDLIDL